MDIPSPLTYSARVAATVSEAIEAQGQTVRGVANSAGIPRATLIRRLSGVTPFTVAELDAIASVLDVPVSTFLGDDSDAA